jgi:gluconate 2-dehydrogenase gamma chain
MPWWAGSASPPQQVRLGSWTFFSANEAAFIEAAVDRLIPPDDLGPGGKDAGCAVFIDRQLAGPYGHSDGLYEKPPFMPGVATQGYQGPDAPATIYRKALADIAQHVKSNFGGKAFGQLAPDDQDRVLSDLENGAIVLKNTPSASFFTLLLQNTTEGFFADPIYGGNRDMVGWKLIGFPGARYDYRDWVERHNETYPLPPVGIMGRSDWSTKD